LFVFKLIGNPCAEGNDYRKQVINHLTQCEEFDNINVSPAERLYYEGKLKVPIEKILKGYVDVKHQKRVQDEMETQLMSEYMTEKFGGDK